MLTIIKIAWLNIWRNKLRSFVVFTSIILGVFAGLVVLSFSFGLNHQRTKSAIENQLSHLQIHDTIYLQDKNETYIINNQAALIKTIESIPLIKSYTNRLILNATITTAHGNKNIKLIGIDPLKEKAVTAIATQLDTGTYFTAFKNHPIIVGKALADKLNLNYRRKAKLGFTDTEESFVQFGFRVEAVYNTVDDRFENNSVFVRKADLAKLSKRGDEIHEIAIMCNNIADMDSVAKIINKAHPELHCQTWKETAPELGYADEMMVIAMTIVLGIIIFALTLGILNTMLMAVLERKKELGVLMSIGMNRTKIFLMIMFETFFLAIIAAPFGLLFSYITISYYGEYGFDLGSFSKGLAEIGADTKIYTKLDAFVYYLITVMIMISSMVSSIFPAWRALNYDPAEAVRSI